jgi:hypothetical protein
VECLDRNGLFGDDDLSGGLTQNDYDQVMIVEFLIWKEVYNKVVYSL